MDRSREGWSQGRPPTLQFPGTAPRRRLGLPDGTLLLGHGLLTLEQRPLALQHIPLALLHGLGAACLWPACLDFLTGCLAMPQLRFLAGCLAACPAGHLSCLPGSLSGRLARSFLAKRRGGSFECGQLALPAALGGPLPGVLSSGGFFGALRPLPRKPHRGRAAEREKSATFEHSATVNPQIENLQTKNI